MLRRVVGALVVVAAVGMASPAGADKDEFFRTGCYVGASGSYANAYGLQGVERELEDPTNSWVFSRQFGPVDAKTMEKGWTAGGRVGCRNRWIGGEVHFEWIEGFGAEVTSAELVARRDQSSVPGLAWWEYYDYKDQSPEYRKSNVLIYYPFMDDPHKDEIDGWALTADAKLYPFSIPFLSSFTLKGRIQPFATLGFGYLKLNAKVDYGSIPFYVDNPDEDPDPTDPTQDDPATDEPNLPTQQEHLILSEVWDGQVRGDEWDFVVRAGGGLEIYLTKHVALTLDAVVVIPTTNELRSFRYFTTGGGLIYRF